MINKTNGETFTTEDEDVSIHTQCMQYTFLEEVVIYGLQISSVFYHSTR